MNKKILVAPLALALFAAGCEDMLKEEPRSFLTLENFYQTADDAEKAVIATYERLQGDGISDWRWFFVIDGMSDHSNAHPLDQNPPAQHPGTLNWDTENSFLFSAWNSYMKIIYRANLAMEKIPESPMAAARQTQAIAELKFLRGWAYLELEKRYGGVPILLTTADHENLAPVRATREQVDAQAIKDLTEAEAILPATRPVAEWGRVTKGAAQMALADIYMWRSSRYKTNEWQQASTWAKKVIDSGQYSLLDDQLQVFLPNNKANREMIFVKVNQGQQTRTSSTVQQAHFPRELTPGGGFGVVTPTRYSYEQFTPGDYRIETSFRFNACNLTGTTCFAPLPMGSQPFKFRPSNQASNNLGDTDIPFYRYAETLLYYAEAQNELGNTAVAMQYVNMIRARARKGAGGTQNRAVPADLSTSLSKLAAREAIYKEREFELIWEVKRWWDILRRNELEPGYLASQLTAHDPLATSQGPITAATEARIKLWPVPRHEVDASNGSLTQNPGY